ncbi:MAG: hypothetical protein AAGA48_11900 [Myxococcota bacterium]
MHFVDTDDLRSWLAADDHLRDYTTGIGRNALSDRFMERELGLPLHLAFVMRRLVAEDPAATMERLSSIPFYSLCKALFLPLSGMSPDKAGAVFGLATPAPPRAAEREVLLGEFLSKDVGLDLVQKLSCILGDPFRGKPATLKRDSLITLLLSMQLTTRRQLLDRLTVVGDVAVLFAESRSEPVGNKTLTAAEVLETLRTLAQPGVGRTLKFSLLRSVVERCSKLEAYFLAKLVLKKAGFGFDYQGPLLARSLAEHFGAAPEAVAHAMALTDAFQVVDRLAREGSAGLQAIQLQPLVPVRPALATGSSDAIKQFPVWVERKYDGIRFMLHKSTDAQGAVLCGAYTRTRRDWLELVPGLAASIRAFPARTAIVDGELYGVVAGNYGARPATVYELYAVLQGEAKPLQIKFAAFDLLYVEGRDLTGMPWNQRRQFLQTLLGPMQHFPLMVPMQLAEGQYAQGKDDVNRLYGHFRSQGYEGIIAKDPQGPYRLAQRDPTWTKRKPAITLDLVLLAAVFAVTEKKTAGVFGSYVIGARTADGGFVDVGDVAGVDVQRDRQLQAEIMREGLITGQRVERKSMSGARPGMELRPHIVVTVRFEGIVKDSTTQELKLRDPKLVHIRSDKSAFEADSVKTIETLWIRQNMG